MAHLVAACTAEPLGVRADSGPGCREVSHNALYLSLGSCQISTLREMKNGNNKMGA